MSNSCVCMYLRKIKFQNEDIQKCQMEFSKLCLALTALGATEKEILVIWSVLAAIYHLGYSGVVQGNSINQKKIVKKSQTI